MAAIGRFLAGALNDQALSWPLLLPLALTAGAAIYMTSPDEPGWAVLLAAFLPPLATWIVLRRARPGVALLFALLACTAGGGIAGKVRTQLMTAPVLREEIGPVR